MKSDPKHRASARGMAMILVMIAVSMVFVVSLVLVSGLPASTRVSRNLIDRERAVYLAESGLSEALQRIKNPPVEGEVWAGATGRSLGGDGTYDVAITDLGDSLYQIDSVGRVSAAGGAYSQSIRLIVRYTGGEVIEYEIDNDEIVVGQETAFRISVLGSAYTSSGVPAPVTLGFKAGGSEIDSIFGSLLSPLAGNVNDGGSHVHTLTDTLKAGDRFGVKAKSWELKRSWYSGLSDSHWKQNQNVVGWAGGNMKATILADGDPIPATDALSADATPDWLSPYLDRKTGTVSLPANTMLYMLDVSTGANTPTTNITDLVLKIELAASIDVLTQTVSTETQVTVTSSDGFGLTGYTRVGTSTSP